MCDFFPPTGRKDLEQFNSRKSFMEISQGIMIIDNIFAANSKTSVKALSGQVEPPTHLTRDLRTQVPSLTIS